MRIEAVSKIGGKGWANTPNIHFMADWKTIESAIVTMITLITGSPIIGRSTTTWIRMPNSAMKTRVIRKPQTNGTFQLVNIHQQTQAPISRNSPCAKFTTWLAL